MDRPVLLASLLGLLTLACGEVVEFQPCYAVSRNCTVKEVRIDPCPEAVDSKPCSIKRGKSASISFDYVPEASDSGLEGKAYWATGTMDLPWVGMNTEGCEFTKCPTAANATNTYTYNLNVSKKFPARNFEVKWKLEKESVMECCILIRIKLVK